MIEILKSPKYDSRPVDGKVDETVLLNSTLKHMDNVLDGMEFFANKLIEAGQKHDYTKIENFPEFHAALESGKTREQPWYKNHIMEERHHLNAMVCRDVNLIDVLEYISDCVMAGSARSNEIYNIALNSGIMHRAFNNTVEMLKKEIVIKELVEEEVSENENN